MASDVLKMQLELFANLASAYQTKELHDDVIEIYIMASDVLKMQLELFANLASAYQTKELHDDVIEIYYLLLVYGFVTSRGQLLCVRHANRMRLFLHCPVALTSWYEKQCVFPACCLDSANSYL